MNADDSSHTSTGAEATLRTPMYSSDVAKAADPPALAKAAYTGLTSLAVNRAWHTPARTAAA